MSRSSIEFTNVGPVAPTAAAVLQTQQDIFQAAFDNKLNIDPATPQGQLMASLAAIVQDKNSQLLFLASQFDPATAEGVWQDALAAIYFLERQGAVATLVQVRCTGLPGTVIAGQDSSVTPARVKTMDGTVLVCLIGGTIPAGGEITLPFVAQATGPVMVEANSVTTIVQAQPGWDTVENPDPGVTGRDVESRQAFEERRRLSVAYNSRSMLASIYARVGNLPGVIDLLARQNRTSAPQTINGVQLSPHSVYIAVLGGADADIAEAIYNSVSGGCDYNGDTDVTYTDPVTGAVEVIRFQRPDAVAIDVRVVVRRTAEVSDMTIRQAKENILSSFYGLPYADPDGVAHEQREERVHIGETVYASRFFCPVLSAGIKQILDITVARKGQTGAAAVMTRLDEVASLAAADISITVQESWS